MPRCYRQRTLMLAAAGEGTQEELAHITSCERCRTVYLRYRHHINRIDHVFRDTTPPPRVRVAESPRPAFWFPVGAVITTALLLMLGVWWGHPTTQSREALTPAERAEVFAFVEDDLSPILFAVDGTSSFIAHTPAADEAYLEAALDDAWLCEQQEGGFTTTCEVSPFQVLFEG
ncbi:MAG: hypothetical protein AB7G75_26545 [Candidatus Binatia bacterium]